MMLLTALTLIALAVIFPPLAGALTLYRLPVRELDAPSVPPGVGPVFRLPGRGPGGRETPIGEPAGASRVADRLRRLIARRRAREEAAVACAEVCAGIATELRAGRTAPGALERAVAELAEPARSRLAPASAAAHSGGDVESVLTGLGAQPGFAGLTGLAACWRVGAETGIGFATVLDRLATTLRADLAHRAEVTAQLAGARSSARLLAALPVVGLALATGLGTNPLTFLFTTPYGLICLTIGLALDALGLLWTHHLATEAENRS